LTIEYEVTIDDVLNVQRFTTDPSILRKVGARLTIAGCVGAVVAIYFEWRAGWPISTGSLVIAVFNLALLYFGLRWMIRPRLFQQPMDAPLKEPLRSQMLAQPWAQGATGRIRLTIDDSGITEERGKSTTVHDWAAVKAVLDAPLHIVISLEGCPRIIIPKCATADPADAITQIERYRAAPSPG
jgi:hypothetical protein